MSDYFIADIYGPHPKGQDSFISLLVRQIFMECLLYVNAMNKTKVTVVNKRQTSLLKRW